MKGYGVVLVFAFSWRPTFELKKKITLQFY